MRKFCVQVADKLCGQSRTTTRTYARVVEFVLGVWLKPGVIRWLSTRLSDCFCAGRMVKITGCNALLSPLSTPLITVATNSK
jgi:hypothetical protein